MYLEKIQKNSGFENSEFEREREGERERERDPHLCSGTANEDFSYAVAAHMELLAAAIRRLASTSRDKNALTLARIPKYNSMIRKLVQIPHLNGSFDISQHGVKLAEQVSAVTAFWPEALWYYVHLWCGTNGL